VCGTEPSRWSGAAGGRAAPGGAHCAVLWVVVRDVVARLLERDGRVAAW
jgi:hypothetical protein